MATGRSAMLQSPSSRPLDVFTWLTVAGLMLIGAAALWCGLTAASQLGVILGTFVLCVAPVAVVSVQWRAARRPDGHHRDRLT